MSSYYLVPAYIEIEHLPQETHLSFLLDNEI